MHYLNRPLPDSPRAVRVVRINIRHPRGLDMVKADQWARLRLTNEKATNFLSRIINYKKGFRGGD